jgi:ribosomal protein S18 acetylase RimI-like enzyme/SAM-dependent methyltransferase
VIRRATLEDARAIAEVHVRAWQQGYRGVVPEAHLQSLSVERREAAWRQALSQRMCEVWVAAEGSAVAGWISVGDSRDAGADARTGELWAVYIDPARWRRGLGRALWRQAEAHLRAAGFTSVTLWVLRDNRPARQFYETLGFRHDPDADRPIELGGASLMEIRLRRELRTDPWDRGDPYDRYVGRWSREVAPRFLSWLAVPAGRRWVDLGCGTGALSAAILERCGPASVIGLEPSRAFARTARAQLGAKVLQASAAALPLARGACDVLVSALVLNFLPDPGAALVEMARVMGPGGVIAAYVWDYAEGMEMIRIFWDAASALDPAAAHLHEGIRFPLCRPAALSALFTGLRDVAVIPLEIPTPFAGFDDYWEPFLGGQGPAPGYVQSLDEPARARLREHLRQRLPADTDRKIALRARAWAVRAVTP